MDSYLPLQDSRIVSLNHASIPLDFWIWYTFVFLKIDRNHFILGWFFQCCFLFWFKWMPHDGCLLRTSLQWPKTTTTTGSQTSAKEDDVHDQEEEGDRGQQREWLRGKGLWPQQDPGCYYNLRKVQSHGDQRFPKLHDTLLLLYVVKKRMLSLAPRL